MTEFHPRDQRPSYARRIIWLGVFVVVAIALYTGGWFFLADRLEREARTAVSNSGTECENLRAEGFPFRMGLFCDRTGYGRDGITATAGAFRSAAQVYDPRFVVGELDGPATLALPGLPALDMNWELFKASSRIATPIPTRFSAEARKLAVSGPAGPLLSAEDAQAHSRVNGADLDVAANFTALALAPEIADGRTLPALSGSLDAVVAGAAAGFNGSLRSRSGEVRSLQLGDGVDAGLTVKGPFSVDENGLLDGRFSISLQNTGRIADYVRQAAPEASERIVSTLGSIGEVSNVPLTVSKGRASILFFQLGEIPPLR